MPYAERRNRFYFEGRCQGSSEFPAIPDIATDACPQCGQRQDIPHHSHVKEFARRSVAEVSADFTIAKAARLDENWTPASASVQFVYPGETASPISADLMLLLAERLVSD